MWTRSGASGDDGFTLFELLIVITILPLVVGAISVALLAVFSNEDSTGNSLTSSGDAQVSSANFVQDVQTAVWLSSASVNSCGGGPVGSSLILSISPDNVQTPATQASNIISYVRTPNTVPTNTFTITRLACTGGTGSASKATVVSHDTLYSNTTVPTTLTINPASVQTSAANGWTPASAASSIQLYLNVPATSHTTSPTSTYAYTLSAVPRTGGTPGTPPGTTSGTSPIIPIELLSSSCPGLSVTGGGVSGDVNAENGSGVAGSGAIGFAASQSQCNSAGTCTGSGCGTVQNSVYSYGAVDPFASLSPPPIPSASGLEAGTCSSSTSICTAGLYGAASTGGYTNGGGSATITGVTFDPSQGTPVQNLVIFTEPVTLNGNVTFDGSPTNMTNVTYWFQQGLTINGTATLHSATYIFGTSGGSGNALAFGNHATLNATDANGTILYVPPGTATVTAPNGDTINVTGNPSYYDGIAIWVASSDPGCTPGTNTLNCTPNLNFGHGNGGSGITDDEGGVYDPLGSVSVGNGEITLNVQFILANSATIATSTVVSAG